MRKKIINKLLTKISSSLQTKFLLFSVILIILPPFAVGTISYIKSSQVLEENVSQANLLTIKQIGTTLQFILQEAEDLSLLMLQNESIRNILKNGVNSSEARKKILEINELVFYLLGSNPYINSIQLKGFKGTEFDSSGNDVILKPDIVSKAIRLKGAYFWITDELVSSYKKTNVFSLIRAYNDINNISNTLGIIRINVDEQKIANIYEKENDFNITSKYYIVDKDNRIISSIDKNEIGKKLDLKLVRNILSEEDKGYFKAKINGLYYLVTYYKLYDSNWKIINLVSLNELFKENGIIKRIVFITIGICLICCCIGAVLISRNIINPIINLSDLMKNLEKNNFSVHASIRGKDEIAMLANSFNKMSDRLNELMNQVYLLQIKQKEAELKALYAQMNPHFLYNTLDTIFWMARSENAFKTSNLIHALSYLLRNSLNSSNKLTTVKEEIEHLKSYIIIQRARFKEQINFMIDVPDEVLDFKVVKFVLQPLVENAIQHGILKKGGTGNISVRIVKREDKLIYEIKDDGRGCDQKEVLRLLKEPIRDNKGLSLKNINDRIKIYFGDEFGLDFYSQINMGTTVIVTQPCILREEELNVQIANRR